jgi:hypothetical protein
MEYRKRLFSCLFAAVLLLSTGSLKTALAQATAPTLGTAQNFAVLGASTVTNTGSTILTGNLGVDPGSAITGFFPPGVVIGTIHAADATAHTAQADALTAYNYLASEACPSPTNNLTGDLGNGRTLLPGVYCYPGTSAELTGTLTLDSTANPNSVFVFQIGTTLTTASNAQVVIKGSSACNVFFQVGSSATLGTGTQLLGSIFAEDSITITTGASVTGGAYALTAAVTLDTNTVTACMGTLSVCKVAGSSSLLGNSFGFSIAGNPATLISVQAGASPLGTCSVALLVPAHPAMITETIPVNTILASVSALPDPGLLISSNLAAGTATVEVDPGGQTIATFVDTVPPPPATGFLQICKVAGANVAVTTPFTFSVAGGTVTVPAGAAPGGTCSPAQVVPAGSTPITETLNGYVLTSVSTLPAVSLVSANLGAGTATVTVNAGGQTIVTFVNATTPPPQTGFLQICKVAGAGLLTPVAFTFTVVGGTPVTVSAGPAPSGTCSSAQVVTAGQIQITETLPPNTALTSVSTLPAANLLVSANLAAGTATVTVNTGGQTTVTFLNTSPPGFLKICKIAGTGVPAGGMFSFVVAGAGLTVPAGTCSQALVFPINTSVTVTEAASSGTVLSLISVVGVATNVDIPNRLATVTVGAGETDVSFTNIAGGVGLLKVCKAAGAGVAPLTMFGFVINGAGFTVPFTVPAGYCVSRGTFPVGTVVTITENSYSPTYNVSAIGILPASAGTVDVPNRSATVAVAVGTTQVTFTNVKPSF